MNKRQVFYVGLLLLAAVVLLGAPLAALAAHPDVTVKTSAGATAGPTDAYSPKMTCGGCHFNCTTGAITGTTSGELATWCQVATQKDCSIAGSCPDYQSMQTFTVTKNQGIPTPTGVQYVDYTVTVPKHGAVTGSHSSEGRNEEMTVAQRTIWGAPAFVSSPGMYGRY